jgi:hypothetical protein
VRAVHRKHQITCLPRRDGPANQTLEMLPPETASQNLRFDTDQFRAVLKTEKLLPWRVRTKKQFKCFTLPNYLTEYAQ